MSGPYNFPNISTDRYSFGPGVLKLGPSGATPSLDVGSVNPGPSLEVTGSTIDVTQGNPQMKVKRFLQTSDVSFSITGIEWDFDNLAKALGAGVTTSTQFDFGGEPAFDELALEFSHRMQSGNTQTIRIWTVVGSGEMTINFSEDLHEFPMTFDALKTDTDWASNSLDGGKKYFRIVETS